MFTPRADGLRKLALASALHNEIQRFTSGVGCYKHRRSTFTLLLEQLEALQDDSSSPSTLGSPVASRAVGTSAHALSRGAVTHDDALRAGGLGAAGQVMSRARNALSDGASYVAVKGGII
jgi:hypothetical protein